MTPINAPHMAEILREQVVEGRTLDTVIEAHLKELGYGR